MNRPLAVVPTYVTNDRALHITRECMRTMANAVAVGDCDALYVDDGSPLDYADAIAVEAERYDLEVEFKSVNEGFSRAVNVGLRKALEDERDAILVNADVELPDEWVPYFRTGPQNDLPTMPDVQGAVLSFPGQPSMIQHAGVYFSVLRREFDHIYRYGPTAMPDTHQWRKCPVTAALMWIDHGTLDRVGLFDEDFRMGYEDVDYCVRVFEAGGECWVNPHVRAIHHERVFRSEQTDKLDMWQLQSLKHLFDKHEGKNFAQYIPTMLGEGVT